MRNLQVENKEKLKSLVITLGIIHDEIDLLIEKLHPLTKLQIPCFFLDGECEKSPVIYHVYDYTPGTDPVKKCIFCNKIE